MIVHRAVGPGSLVLDATVGNGHDTVFLAETVGAEGIVVGLDVQETALKTADDRLNRRDLRSRVRLFHRGHEHARDVLSEFRDRPLMAAMYNLGYLPGFDKMLKTRPATTVRSLTDVAEIIAEEGVVTVVAYSGHPGGKEETRAVAEWCRQLPRDRFVVTRSAVPNQGSDAPRLFAVSKTAESVR